MTTAIRYEVTRLRTLRSTWLLASAGVALTGFIAYLAGTIIDVPALTARQFAAAVSGTGVFLPLVAIVLGAMAMGHEYRHRTLDLAVAAVPSRLPLLCAKAVVVPGTAALTAVVAGATAAVLGKIGLGERVPIEYLINPALAASIGRMTLLVALYALAGLAVGTLVSSLTAALVGLVAVPWMVEPLAALGLRTDQARWLPFLAGQQIVRHGDGLLSPLTGGLYFAGLITLALLGAAVVLKRRDV